MRDCANCLFKNLDPVAAPCNSCHFNYCNWTPVSGVVTAPAAPVAVADDAGGAVKADTGKAPISLVPRSAIVAEAEVLGFGAQKYAAHNWRKGMKWSRLGDAALRHLLAWIDGEDVDPETGLSHLAHLRCCAGFLIEYQAAGLGDDDRFRREAAE